jgi:hypothetical protein
VYVHGLAGDRAAEVIGQIPLIATDIINCLPVAFDEVLQCRPLSGRHRKKKQANK